MLKDLLEFMVMIEKKTSNSFMCSLDSLFTNVSLGKTKEIVIKAVFGRQIKIFPRFIKINKMNTYMNGKYYNQLDGLAMRPCFARAFPILTVTIESK